jgi:uncharacterized membrane protein (UPF0127 family)
MPLEAKTKVRLGDGREGVIVRQEERAGFNGYIVQITNSIDKVQIGTTVGATEPGMQKLSFGEMQQLQQPGEETKSVETVQEGNPEEFVKKQKDLIKKQIPFKQRELTLKQQELTDLQQMSAAITNPNMAEDQFENLEKLEETEQNTLEQRQNLDMQQQEMQQGREQFQQETTQRQLETMQPTQPKTADWIKSEPVNAKIIIGNNILICDVAATPRQQASGLQAYSKLADHCGLWFPFSNRKTASFHMGQVKFPIDIVFVDDNRITHIASNVQPRQCGSWSSVCTDVIETAGGWCAEYDVRVGDKVVTPLTGKQRIAKLKKIKKKEEEEEDITATKSYDLLRTITVANLQGDRLIKAIHKVAIEHRLPDQSTQRAPQVDKRNPQTRFLHQDRPDVREPEGDENPSLTLGEDVAFGDGNYGKHWHLQRGYDPVELGEDAGIPRRPSAQKLTVDSPSDPLYSFDKVRLKNSSVILFDSFGPDWMEEEETPRGYEKIAIIDDGLISKWVDSLGFNEEAETQLREAWFTDSFKRLIGNALSEQGRIQDFELLDSDLVVYK